jgi:hypothetical protein
MLFRKVIVLLMFLFVCRGFSQVPDFPGTKFGIEVFGTTGSYLTKKENYNAELWKPGAGVAMNLWVLPKKACEFIFASWF